MLRDMRAFSRIALSGFSTASAMVFPAAVDLLDTLGPPQPCVSGRQSRAAHAPAIRLSTGATASARFPVISPPAGIRTRQGEVDMVVDGGYFENDGLTSARQLAEALHRVRKDLPRAVTLHVTNEPTLESHGNADVPPRQPRASNPYDAVSAPFLALAATRVGHAAEAINAARDSRSVREVLSFQVGAAAPDQTRKPVADIKKLSMSWWLSGAVQAYLDRQLCTMRNVRAYDALDDVSADGLP